MVSHLQIYVADDSIDDRQLLEHCVQRENLSPVQYFEDGEALMEYCDHNPKRSFLLLLDLKMPKADGFHVLKWMKSSRKHKCNPVIVLSSSQEQCDVRKAYELGANAFWKNRAISKGTGGWFGQ